TRTIYEMSSRGNARPHPGPLPQERGKHAQFPEILMLSGVASPHRDLRRLLPGKGWILSASRGRSSGGFSGVSASDTHQSLTFPPSRRAGKKMIALNTANAAQSVMP